MQTLGVGEEVMLGELVYLMYSVDTFQKLRLQHQRLWDGNGWESRGGPRSLPSVTTRKARLLLSTAVAACWGWGIQTGLTAQAG